MITLGLLPRVSLRWSALTLGVVTVAGLLPVGIMVLTGRVIAALPAAGRAGSTSPQARRVMVLLGVIALTFLASSAIEPFRLLCSQILGRKLDLYLRERVMRATLAPAGVAHLEDPATLDAIGLARGVGPGEWTPGIAVVGLGGVTEAYVGGLAAAVIVGRYAWWLALALVCANLYGRLRFRGELVRIVSVMLGEARAQRRAIYMRDLALTPGVAKEMRIFGLRRWTRERFRAHWMSAMREIWRERKGNRRAVPVMVALACIVNFGSFAWLGHAAVRGSLSLSVVAVLAQAIFGVERLGNLDDSDLNVTNGTAAIPSALALEQRLAPARTVSLATRSPDRLPRREIRFEGVAFAYPGAHRRIYDGLDLTIPAGRSLAIVGANGAGKTTLVKLLARLYEPSAGRISVDGIDVRELEPHAWQRRVGAIFQDFVQYQMSAADNIAFGAIDRAQDREAIAEAARRVGADAIIDALPQGMDTVLSRQFSGGSEVSGGQWQRIALARALFAVQGGAGILVLDEPTANLDVRAEAELFDRFLDLTRGSTTILISHRFSTVRRADRIVVLDEGRVTEQGTHDELVALGGTYAEMFRLQAARFTEEVQA